MAIPALLDHARQERLDAVDRAPQVDVDHPAPVAVGDVSDRASIGDACVVEDQVHLAEQAEGFVGEVLDGVKLADVAQHTVCFRAVGAEPLDRLVQRGLVDVGEHDPGTAASEFPRRRETDTARASGDYRSAPLESLHGAKTIGLVNGVNRRTGVEVDEGGRVPLRQREADIRPLPGVASRECRHPDGQPVRHGRAVTEQHLFVARQLGGGQRQCGAVLLEEFALAAASVLDGQGTLEEVAEIERPVAPAHHLPVQESDVVVGQHVGVADVRVAVQEGLR